MMVQVTIENTEAAVHNPSAVIKTGHISPKYPVYQLENGLKNDLKYLIWSSRLTWATFSRNKEETILKQN